MQRSVADLVSAVPCTPVLKYGLVLQTLLGMQDDAVGSAAGSLLHQLLHYLKLELVNQTGVTATPRAIADLHLQ